MSTEVMSPALGPRLRRARPPSRCAARTCRDGRRHRVPHHPGRDAAAVPPVGQRQGRGRPEPRPFRRGASPAGSISYALKNSLILGAWTGLFSLIIGLTLAWTVSRTDVPAKPFLQLTATLSYLSPPFLTAIAFTYLFSPNAGLINVLMRDVARPAVAHLQHLLDAGSRAGHGAAHVPVRLSAGIERASVGRRLLRGGGADPRRQQAAHRVLDHGAAGRAGDPVGRAARRSSTPSRCSARRRSSGCPAAS